ncbi:MAG: 4-hydroxythreonine-4-phosphate dehydrogenase PdxA [Candidatus Omnitrophica bacterium]|nr:4-hydroxythreonine-4-phosphate dehydrogenase PdxA [Candidatus Omnitrophota bacterium]
MRSKNPPTLRSGRIRIALTIGDPSGVGPAIALKAIRSLENRYDFTVIGDKWVFSRLTGRTPQFSRVDFIDLVNVRRKNFSFGRINPRYGRASVEYLDEAMRLIRRKEADCLVTCPVSKEAINRAGFHYGGHTEYLAEHSGAKHVTMMLLNRFLRFSMVTRHVPIRGVPGWVNKGSLRQAIVGADEALIKLFLLKDPRIVVCGLNPHASDRGLIGEEETGIIEPEIRRLKAKLRSSIDGPLPADVAVYRAYKGEYDAVVAMYHDQALIPLKLSDPKTGVNMTLGLPFVRTSPLHGTAFDIAGSLSKANPASLIEAIRLAAKCALNLKKA